MSHEELVNLLYNCRIKNNARNVSGMLYIWMVVFFKY
ncbi:MAG: hypothetical protein P8N23_03960 [Methylophilaceae bacterium]|nr:hypothetical protein [Methylophilaceae bacterium]MDG1454133.1 hypothetical protein [Methylophilaceae bacterium]